MIKLALKKIKKVFHGLSLLNIPFILFREFNASIIDDSLKVSENELEYAIKFASNVCHFYTVVISFVQTLNGKQKLFDNFFFLIFIIAGLFN